MTRARARTHLGYQRASPRRAGARAWPLVLAGAALLPGCSAPGPATTLYQASDLQMASASLREQLAGSSWLAGRTPASAPIVLLPDEVTNRSNERVPEGDAWATVGRMLFEPGMQVFFRERAVQVLMPPERLPALRRAGIEAPPGYAQGATHFLRGALRSATRTAALDGRGPSDLRADTFLLDLSVVERDSGRAVWSGVYEFKRYARGLLAD